MIVEFFGISGVGKSTICKEIYANNNVKWPRYKLYENNSWLVRNIKKFVAIILFLLSNLKWVIKLNTVLNEYININQKDRVNLFFNGCSLKILQKKCKYIEEKYIFDEGVFQYIWAIYLRVNRKPLKEEVENILSLFSIPNKIYVITADSDVILKRLILRNRKTKLIEANDVTSKIEQMKDILNDILELSENYLQKTEIIFLDTTDGGKYAKEIRI